MSFREQVEAAIPGVSARVAPQGISLELVNAREDGVIELAMSGKSIACPMSQTMLAQGILRMLKQDIPEIVDVVSIGAQ